MRNSLGALVIIITVIVSGLTAESAQYDSNLITVSTSGDSVDKSKDVVLIHGFASSSDVWNGTVEELSDDFNLHLVQIKGFAGTPSPTDLPEEYLKAIRDSITQYINVKKLEKPVVAGHSMGALLSLLIASQNPDLVSRVIVVDALPFYSLIFSPQATSEQIKPMAQQVKNQLLSLKDQPFAEQVENSVSIMTKVDAKQDVVTNWSLTSDREVYANILAEVMSYDARPELSNIQVPVVVINAFDNAMPVNKEGLTKLYRNAYSNAKVFELQTIEDSYHFIMWDQPQLFYEALKSVLDSKSAD